MPSSVAVAYSASAGSTLSGDGSLLLRFLLAGESSSGSAVAVAVGRSSTIAVRGAWASVANTFAQASCLHTTVISPLPYDIAHARCTMIATGSPSSLVVVCSDVNERLMAVMASWTRSSMASAS